MSIGPQRFRRVKRLVLGPLTPSVQRWAMQGPVSPAKLVALRRIVLPGVVAARAPFERRLDNGLVFRATTEDFLAAMVYIFGVWEPLLTAFLRRRLGPGRVFVDVGANLGWFALDASTIVGPSGGVVAIEAAPDLVSHLTSQISANRLTNVRVINHAIGARAGWVRILPGPSTHTGLTRVAEVDSPNFDDVAARTLPEVLRPSELQRCRAIKIDVEGYEFDVIKGLVTILPLIPPDAELIVEVAPSRAPHITAPEELFSVLGDYGFWPYELPNTYTVRAYRTPERPRALKRLTSPPTVQTDVVFSRVHTDQLPF